MNTTQWIDLSSLQIDQKYTWCPFFFFFLPLPFKHPDSGPACSQSHFRGIFLEIDGRFFLFLFFFPNPFSILSLPPPQVWQNNQRKHTPSVQQQCWLSQREERNRRNTSYHEVALKAPFFFFCLTERHLTGQISPKVEEEMPLYLILPPRAVGTSCLPSQHFQGGLYQSIAGPPLLRFRVVKPANFWADLRWTCEVAPLAGNWIHIQGTAGCWNVA